MKIFKLFAFMAACFMMAACGSSDEASKVASKINAGDQLTENDYTVMIDYCGKYAEEAQKIQDKVDALPVDSEESEKLNEEMATLADKYSYTVPFFDKISNCTQAEIGEKNVDLINKYAPLMWFSAPEWASLGGDENVAGFVEDMPKDSDSVIATGDGVAVE